MTSKGKRRDRLEDSKLNCMKKLQKIRRNKEAEEKVTSGNQRCNKKDKIQNNSKSTEQHAKNESNTELPKPDTNEEVKTGETSGGNFCGIGNHTWRR